MLESTNQPGSLAKSRVLSGIQPTADSFQVGNYLGALRNWVALQHTHDAYYCVADLHAITSEYDPDLLRQRTLSSAAQLIAAGIDPDKAVLFVQSQVPEHTQLSWVLSCIAGFGEAARMTQFKDKSSKTGTSGTSVGLFTYPILQAADILVYQADDVPVGEDQRQHLELTRDLAIRFNARFGQTFTVPRPLIVSDTAKILDLADPTSKMSKTLPTGCLFLMDPPKKIEKKIKSAVTDSEAEIRFDAATKPGVSNLLSILSAFSGESIAQLEKRYADSLYGPFKQDVANAVVEFATGYQQRTNALLDDRAELTKILVNGSQRARDIASETLRRVYDRVGFVSLPTGR